MQNQEEQDEGQERNKPNGGHNGNNGRNYAPKSFIQPDDPFMLLEEFYRLRLFNSYTKTTYTSE